MSPSKGSQKNFFDKWIKDPWNNLITTITGILTIFVIGYSIGAFKEELDNKLKIIEIKEQCNERLQSEINDCRQLKMDEYKKSVDQLEVVVKELQSKKYEK